MAKIIVKTEGISNPVMELRLGVNRVGRTPDNHLQLDHPTVSSLHCELELRDGMLVVRDCNSTNGTYVNGQRVMEVALRVGETFLLGDVELVVESTDETVAIPRADQQPPAPPVVLPDGALLCPRHPRARATYQCTQCHEVMCDACVHHLQRSGGKAFHLCLKCSGNCQAIGVVEPPKKKSLLEKFKQTVTLSFTREKPGGE